MLYPEFNLCGHKSKLESLSLIGEVNEIQIPVQPCEFYVSVYRFNSDIAALPSLSNLPTTALAYADYLVFDFDHHSDLSLPLGDCRTVCQSLTKIGATYRVYFSGGKGFHICVPTNQFGFEPTVDADILKRMAEAIAHGCKTWDPSVYNRTRIFRAAGTLNSKGGMYKVPVDIDTSLEEILDKAKHEPWSNIGDARDDLPQFSLNESLRKLYEACKIKVNRTVQENVKLGNGSLFTKVAEGGRNEAAYILTRKLARRGIFERDSEFIVQAWNQQLPKPLPAYEVTKVVQSAYTKGMNEFIDEGSFANHIYEIGRAITECSTSFSKQGQGAFYTGYDFMDKLSMGFYAGEVIGIHARNGNFKTAFLENLLQRGSQKVQRPVLFFSMEMPNSTLTLRRVQKSYGLTKKEAIDWVKSNADRTKLIEDWKWVKTCYLSNLGIEEMLGLVDYYSETFGPLAAIGIDYLGLCKGANNNRERTARMATDLKTRLARGANAPVFVLTQAKAIYEGERGSIELDRSCPKDSDTIIDSLDYSFGLWKKWGQVDNTRDFLIFGKPMKDRGIDMEAWGGEPYFYLNFAKPFMDLKDITFVANPPPFEKLDKSHKGDE